MRLEWGEICAAARSERDAEVRDLDHFLRGGNRPERRGSDGYQINAEYLKQDNGTEPEIAFLHGELMLRFLRATRYARRFFIKNVWEYMLAHRLVYLEIELRWGEQAMKMLTVTRTGKERLAFGIL
ncbi:MAG TPA: hypothetical protein VHO23_02360 [Candidatus Paceibacterota bacterium]|nr:hypothetical protein [Candidatus Paceibacterota bacterium]